MPTFDLRGSKKEGLNFGMVDQMTILQSHETAI